MVRIRTIAPKGVVPEPPTEDQESVWDYPRPPALEGTQLRIRVTLGDEIIADTRRALRVLETSHPPTYYIPPEDVSTAFLVPTHHTSACEWKGQAEYHDIVTDTHRIERAAWTYRNPLERFEAIAGYFAFYPAKLHCTVDGEQAAAQDGGFYGGWITSHVAGPFKGAPQTLHW